MALKSNGNTIANCRPSWLGVTSRTRFWTNLIVNAADAMKDKGKLLIRTSREGRWLKVQITDDGPGIPDAIKTRIFEPFFTTKPVGEGTGWGWMPCIGSFKPTTGKSALTAAQAKTTFTLRLPLTQPVPINGAHRN